MSGPGNTRRAAAAELLLLEQGYSWLPMTGRWEQTLGLPLEELPHAAPGWYSRWQMNASHTKLRSTDGYCLVTRCGRAVHFNLDLKEVPFAASTGFADRVCFVPIEVGELLGSVNESRSLAS